LHLLHATHPGPSQPTRSTARSTVTRSSPPATAGTHRDVRILDGLLGIAKATSPRND
jgi:hypothetical protein